MKQCFVAIPNEKHILLRIVRALSSYDNYFIQWVDAANKEDISSIEKCTSAMQMLAYGVVADAIDEYIRIRRTTSLECLRRFCEESYNCMSKSTWELQLKMTCKEFCTLVRCLAFKEWLEILIACIRNGKIVQQRGNVSLQGEIREHHCYI